MWCEGRTSEGWGISTERYRFQVAVRKSIVATRANRTERTAGWTRLDMGTDSATTQCCHRTSTFQNRASHSSGHDGSQSTSIEGQERKWTNHTHLQFPHGGAVGLDWIALMSVISWRSGRIDRVYRSATCTETRAMVDVENKLFGLRYQWSEMSGNAALVDAPG